MYVYFYRGKKAYKNQYNRGFSIQVNELGFRHFNLLMRANSLGGGGGGVRETSEQETFWLSFVTTDIKIKSE